MGWVGWASLGGLGLVGWVGWVGFGLGFSEKVFYEFTLVYLEIGGSKKFRFGYSYFSWKFGWFGLMK